MISRERTSGSFVTPRVLVLNYDPVFHSRGDEPLHAVCGWNDPRRLTEEYIADLAECSGGYVRYQVSEWQDIDAFPVGLRPAPGGVSR